MELQGGERHRWANREVEWSEWDERHRRQSCEGSSERTWAVSEFQWKFGKSDIEGKVALGSGENGAAGRERHRWENREVDMGGST